MSALLIFPYSLPQRNSPVYADGLTTTAISLYAAMKMHPNVITVALRAKQIQESFDRGLRRSPALA